MPENRNGKIKIVIIAVVIILILATAFLALDKLRPSVPTDVPSPKDAEKVMNAIELPSGTFYKRNGVDNYLVIGLDTTGEMTSSESYYNTEQADYLVLVSVDRTNKTCSFLQINRDTMAYVQELGVTGQKYATTAMQIALAHTYGDGLQTSCFNTVDAVSNLLYGINIDYYVAMTMDAVQILTDYLGGVEITFEGDYADINPAFCEGEKYLLSGDEALTFIRARRGFGDSTNIARQKRQQEFLTAFIKQLKSEHVGADFINGAYDSVGDYILTNAYMSKLTTLLSNMSDYSFGQLVTPDGVANYVGEYVEFYVDPTDLERIIVNMFCE